MQCRYFGLAVLGSSLVAVGGYAGREGGFLDSEEESSASREWTRREDSLGQARISFGELVVTAATVC